MIWVCTISDYGAHPTLAASAKIHNIQLHNLIVHPWTSHGLKLTILKQFALLHPDDPVLFVDACDTVFCNSHAHLEQTVHKLLSSHKVVFSSEKTIYPDQTKALYQSLLDKGLYTSPNAFLALNSGVMLGLGRDLVALFERMSDEQLLIQGHGSNGSDQGVITRWFVDQKRGQFSEPDIGIDHGCELAVSHAGVDVTELDVGRSTTFRTTGSQPCIIHFNGQSFRKGETDLRFEYLNMMYFN
jgi:hypothetical protein